LIGDANAHTANLPDYKQMDEFLARYFCFDDDFLYTYNSLDILLAHGYPASRCSKNSKVNSTGLKLLDLCKNNNYMFISNGRVGNDINVGTFRTHYAIQCF
jgi:hypothetical protein